MCNSGFILGGRSWHMVLGGAWQMEANSRALGRDLRGWDGWEALGLEQMASGRLWEAWPPWAPQLCCPFVSAMWFANIFFHSGLSFPLISGFAS